SMPPAFNLSQDQTLQFNLCKLSSKLTWKNQFHVSIRVFLFAKHHITYAMQRRPPTPNAHTYRLLIFKERATNTIRPFGLDADRKTVSFVASLCQQRRIGLWACRIGLSNAFDEIFATESLECLTFSLGICSSSAPEASLQAISPKM
ncbi:hypothetical protein, partial [Lautropia mirabilis]